MRNRKNTHSKKEFDSIEALASAIMYESRDMKEKGTLTDKDFDLFELKILSWIKDTTEYLEKL